MNQNLKKIARGLILVIGLLLFFSSLLNNHLNLSLIYLTSTLIIWVLYGLILDDFDVRIFAWVISATGFLLAISVFVLYGVEEVPHPVGAIVFHTGGIAGALGMGLFSLFPLLVMHQFSSKKATSPATHKLNGNDTTLDPGNDTAPDPELDSDEWEFATEDELKSGEWETT